MRTKLAIVLGLTAVFLAVVLWDLDVEKAWQALQQTDWWFLVPMWLCYLVAHALRSWRLLLLVDMPVKYSRVFSINTVGFLAINVIPLRLGEMVRPYLLAEREGVPFARGLAAILLERLLDMLMLLLMLLGLTWMVDLPDGGVVVKGVDVIAAGQQLASLILVLGVAGIVALFAVGEPLIRLIGKFPMGEKIGGFAHKFRDGIIGLAKKPLRFAWLLVLSATIWVVTMVAVGVVMAAFPGVPVGIAEVWSTWSITLSGMTAVPTPGFFGAYELFCAAALWLWGVDADLGRTFAVVLHMGQFIFTVGLGAVFLVNEGLSLGQLVTAPPTAPPSEEG